MSGIQQLNRALLRTLMSSEAADVVADRLEELEADAGRLRTENYCLKQDLEECRHLMRKALPTIDSRETDYADDFRAMCEANGSPEKFRCFKNGWEAAMKHSVPLEDMRAMQVALAQEKDDKIDSLRTELAATRMACEDWIKIANAGASDTARINWMSEQGRIDYAVSYWVPSDTQTLREKIDAAAGFLANKQSEPRES